MSNLKETKGRTSATLESNIVKIYNESLSMFMLKAFACCLMVTWHLDLPVVRVLKYTDYQLTFYYDIYTRLKWNPIPWKPLKAFTCCSGVEKHRLQKWPFQQQHECTLMICETTFNVNIAGNISWLRMACNCAWEISISTWMHPNDLWKPFQTSQNRNISGNISWLRMACNCAWEIGISVLIHPNDLWNHLQCEHCR